MAKEQWTYYDPVKAAAEMISIYSPETDRFAITPVQDSKESVTEQVAEASDVLELGKHDNHGSVGGDVDPVKPYPNWSQKNGGSPVKKVQYVDGQQKVFDRPSIERKTVATDIQLPVYHDNHNSVGSDMDPVNSYPNCSQRNEESPARKEPYTDRQRQVFERPSIERVTVATDVQVPSYRDNRGSVSGSTNPVNPYPSWSREDGGTTAKKRPYEDRISKRPSVDMNETDDDSYQFLVSLLPYLRQIPKHRKLTVRHRLQRVLIDEENTIYVAYNNAGASASTGRDNTCYANVPGNNHGKDSRLD